MKAQEFLAKGDPKSVQVALVTGDEAYFRERVIDMIAATCDDVESVDGPSARDGAGFDLGEFLEGMRTGSLFGGTRLVRVRAADHLVKQHSESLIALISSGEMAHRLVLEGESLVAKATKAGATGAKTKATAAAGLAGAVEAASGVVIRCDPLWSTPPPWGGSAFDTELVQWICAETKRRGKVIRPVDAHLLQERAGSDLRGLVSQIEKLITFTGPSGAITAEHIEATVVSSRSTPAFDLAEAVASADTKQAFILCDALFELGVEEPNGRRNNDPQSVAILCTAAIASKVRKLLHACERLDRGASFDEAAEAAGVYRTFAARFREQTDVWMRRDRSRVLERIVALDRALKSGGGPPRVLLETFIAESLGFRVLSGGRR